MSLRVILKLPRISPFGGFTKSESTNTTYRFVSLASFLRGAVVPFKLSDIGEGIREVTIKEWFVKPGDRVSQFDEICEVQSDKASVTITSRYDGLIKTLHHEVDQVVLVGNALVDVELDEATDQSTEVSAPIVAGNEPEKGPTVDPSGDHAHFVGKTLATPAVRRIAMEHKIRLKDVVATGKDGRVLKEDILSHIDRTTRPTEKTTEKPSETIALKGYEKHMWNTMTESLKIPHFVYSDECDVRKLVECRNEVRQVAKDRGVSLTFVPFFVKAASRALEKMPRLNSLLDEESRELRVSSRHNICVAMDTPNGLVVPNIKDVQDLSVLEIARELNRLQDLGRKSSIPPADLTGGTFSLSNIGVIGGTYTKPVILPPQVAIGAIGRAQRVPRFDANGNVIAADVVCVSWAADHRVIDGVTMAKYSNLWKYYVENPAHLLVGL